MSFYPIAVNFITLDEFGPLFGTNPSLNLFAQLAYQILDQFSWASKVSRQFYKASHVSCQFSKASSSIDLCK